MEQLSGARKLQRRNVTLSELNLRQSGLPRSSVIALKSLGVTKRARHKERDWIAEHLDSLYTCTQRNVWHQLLADEYEHALQILIEVRAYPNGQYSEWLSLQDSWNDAVTRKLVEFLHKRGQLRNQKLVTRAGTLTKYGSLLAENSPLDRLLPAISSRFRDIHQRRNQLPGSHPYDEKGGQRNKFLKAKEYRQLSS